MVSVTFPSRPMFVPPPGPPSKAASDPNAQGFEEVFALLRSEPGPPERPTNAQDTATDAADPVPDAPAPDVATDQKKDVSDPAVAEGRLVAPPDSPARFFPVMDGLRADAAGLLSVPEPMSDGIQALPSLFSDMAVLSPVRAEGAASPVIPAATADPAQNPPVLPPETKADVQTMPVQGPPGDGASGAPPAGGTSPPPAVPPAPAQPVQAPASLPFETEIIAGGGHVIATDVIAADDRAATDRRSPLPSGVPAFWAAREAAETEAAVPQDPAQAFPVDLQEGPALRKAVGPPEIAEPPLPDRDETPTLRDAKTAPGPAPVQSIPAGALQTVQLPVNLPLTPSASAAPTLPPQVPAHIAAALAARPERPIELRLAPTELGGLTVNLRQDGEILRVVVQADRPETLDLLRRNGDILLEELRLAGFSGTALSFGDGGGAQDRQAEVQARPTRTDEAPLHRPTATPQASDPAQVAQGLDLRL